MIFEACVDSVASAVSAVRGGAGRLELCESLVEGGVTPSAGKVRAVIRAVSVPVHVLIRPRGGDFCYDEDELSIMYDDIVTVKAAGASGVVLGVLAQDGTIDTAKTAQLIAAARPMSVTFHRAIDVTRHPMDAFLSCIALGVDRVLTSGSASSALAGAGTIAAMVEKARVASSSIIVLAGGGVTPSTAAQIVRRTGVSELHGTARASVRGRYLFECHPPVYMGGERHNTPDVELMLKVCSEEVVCAIVQAMRAAVGPTDADRLLLE